MQDPNLYQTPTVHSSARVEIVDDNPVFKPTWDFRLAFLALSTLGLAVAFDATTLSVALPTISTDLGGTALQAFWSGTSFLLASTALQPTVASFSNIFGRKYVRLPHLVVVSLLDAVAERTAYKDSHSSSISPRPPSLPAH